MPDRTRPTSGHEPRDIGRKGLALNNTRDFCSSAIQKRRMGADEKTLYGGVW